MRARLGTYPAVLVLTTAMTALVLTVSPVGSYLEEPLFLKPVFILKSTVGLQAELPSEVRVVMADDATLKQLGRQPTFAEWLEVADRLFAMGYERIFLQEAQDLASTVGSPKPRAAKGFFAVGIVDAPASKSIRALSTADVPRKFGIPADDPGESLPVSQKILGPDPSTFSLIDGLGINNVDAGTAAKAPVGIRSEDGRVFPHIGLLADGALRWEDGQFVGARGPIPAQDGKVFVNFITLKSIVASAVPMRGFFEESGGTQVLAATMREGLVERLRGGKIAYLLPAAYSGARYTISPVEGAVPAYINLLSLATASLTGNFAYSLLSPVLLIWLALPMIWVPLLLRRTRPALLGAGGLWLTFIIGALLGFLFRGWVLPGASVSLVYLTGILAKSLHHLLITVGEKGKLEQELELGRVVQNLLLPTVRRGRIGEWEFMVFYRPYGSMAGDWFQVCQCPDGRGVVAIGDVTGKGASAALITSTIAGLWHAESKLWAKGEINIGRFMETLNDSIQGVFQGQQNTTIQLAVIDRARIAVYRSAAPRWLRLVKEGPSKTLESYPIAPIGMAFESGIKVQDFVVEPKPGDTFVAYSDGVLESHGCLKRFLKAPATLDFSSSDAVMKGLEALALETAAADELADDLTLLVLRYVGQGADKSGDASAA